MSTRLVFDDCNLYEIQILRIRCIVAFTLKVMVVSFCVLEHCSHEYCLNAASTFMNAR